MTKNELKKIIRECLNEIVINEGLPIGKTKEGREAAITLNNLIGKISRPDFQNNARRAAAEIINLIDDDAK